MKRCKQKLSNFFSAMLMTVVVGGTIPSAYAVDSVPPTLPGLFELDGNPQNDSGPGLPDDWETLWNGGANDGGTGSHFKFSGIIFDGLGQSIFTQGGSKDRNDTTQWKYKNGSVPDKDEIFNGFSAAYIVTPAQATGLHQPGDTILYFGFDRIDNNGAAFGGVWYFQNPTSAPNPTNNAQSFITSGHVARDDSTGTRGDILVLANFHPSGPQIRVYEWDPNDEDGDGNEDEDGKSIHPLDQIFSSDEATCDGTGNKVACAITNVEGGPTVDTVWPFTAKGDTGQTAEYPHDTFFSGGLNISALLGQSPCFTDFLIETRSSDEESAQLKDFVIGSLELCGIELTKDPDVDNICNNFDSDVEYTYVISNTGAGDVKVTLEDDAGTPNDPSDDEMIIELTDNIIVASGDDHTEMFTFSIAGSGDITNTATAKAFDVVSGVQVGDDAIAMATVTTESCLISIDKEADRSFVCDDNDAVNYTITVNNDGTAELTGVDIEDDLLGVIATDVTIAPESSIEYNSTNTPALAIADVSSLTCTPNEDDSCTVTNTVTASNAVALGQTLDDATAFWEVDVHTCEISVIKECDNAVGEGEPINYSGRVTNDGTATVTNLTAEDVNFQFPGGVALTLSKTTLLPGEFATFSGSYIPDQSSGGPHEDTVTADGTVFAGTVSATAVSNEGSASCNIETNPELELTKECTDGGFPPADSPIHFTASITNVGDVTVSGITVHDSQTGDLITGLELEPGETMDFNEPSQFYTPEYTWNKNTVSVTAATDAVNPVNAVISNNASAVCQGCPFVDNPQATGDSPDSPGDL